MSRNLTKLLGDSVRTRVAVSELRRMAGDDSDVRLITEILARAHSIIRALGLDPADTTGREVYQALMAAAPRIDQIAWARASDWVMMDFDGQVISFHPVDIVENYHHQLPYGQHRIESGKRARTRRLLSASSARAGFAMLPRPSVSQSSPRRRSSYR